MIWLETPTNPTMKIVDIEAVSKLAHSMGDILVVADNTFMSPYFQRPLMWGAGRDTFFQGHYSVRNCHGYTKFSVVWQKLTLSKPVSLGLSRKEMTEILDQMRELES